MIDADCWNVIGEIKELSVHRAENRHKKALAVLDSTLAPFIELNKQLTSKVRKKGIRESGRLLGGGIANQMLGLAPCTLARTDDERRQVSAMADDV
jgi:hypothetical protein